MSEKSLRFARHIGFNALGQIALAAINFLTVPYLVRRMGTQTYGLYLIMYSAASYLQLSSLGADSAVVRHAAAAQGARNRRALHDTLRYSAWFHALGALAAGAALWWGARFVAVRVFHVPSELASEAVFVLRCVAFSGVFVGVILGAGALMAGLQRFDLQSATNLMQNGFMPLGAAALMAVGFGLREVVVWYGVLNVLAALAAAALIWRLLQPARHYHEGTPLRLGTFSLYGLTLWSGALAGIVANQFDKLLIARQISLVALTLYSIPAGLLQRLQVVPTTVGAVSGVMMFELQGEGHDESLRRMCFKSSRFILWVCLPHTGGPVRVHAAVPLPLAGGAIQRGGLLAGAAPGSGAGLLHAQRRLQLRAHRPRPSLVHAGLGLEPGSAEPAGLAHPHPALWPHGGGLGLACGHRLAHGGQPLADQ
jgi:O-antigen/teichoic acid export membrane protein